MRPSSNYGLKPPEIGNTGLRPNWNSFWALELSSADLEPSRPTSSLASCKSAMSGGTGVTGIRHIRFITGSEWIGEWDRTGMTGMGLYRMPHGVIYEGTMKSGLFEGVGVLKYPNGSFLEGLWYQGRLKYWQYDYADGLERDCNDWTYCSMPDRRFFSEHVDGFRPANSEKLTNDYPAREVPQGHYDVGQGFYNPKSHCVVDAITGEVISIPTADEVKWILERCRTSEPTGTVGHRPDLYENWYTSRTPSVEQESTNVSSEESEREDVWQRMASYSHGEERQSLHESQSKQPPEESDKALVHAGQEILSLLDQEGAMLQPMTTSYISRRKYSLHEKIEGEQAQEQLRGASFEGMLKKILKDMEVQKQSVKSSDDSGRKGDTISNDSNLLRLTQIINAFSDGVNRKKTASSSVGSGALEQFRMIGKLLPLQSLSRTPSKQFPYSHTAHGTVRSSDSHKTETIPRSSRLKKHRSEESMIHSTNYDTGGSDCY